MLLSDGGMAGSCERTSILLTINNQVVDGLVHRLQVFHIVELYQERQALMFVQIICFFATEVFSPQYTDKYDLFLLLRMFIISHLHILSTLLIRPLKNRDWQLIEN